MSTTNPSVSTGEPRQKILGDKGLVILIALLSAFVPLSTDLYLPALPGMSEHFGAPADQINLTLVVFFIFYSFGTLAWGPLSDCFGRKPVLVVGLGTYILASCLCATAWDVTSLIIFRALQAAGGSAAGTVATAVVKDVYSGRKREKVLAIVQSMTLIAPAVGPVLGAFLLGITSWRGVFWTLAIIGVLAFLGSIAYQETIVVRNREMSKSLVRMGKVLQNRGFTQLLVVFSIGSISSMAYIASSTYIYQQQFMLSEQAYSFYFALNALGLISGPMLFLRLSRHIHSEKIIPRCFLAIAISGVLLCFLGNLQPWVFLLCLLPSSIAGSCMRAPASNLMLEQQKTDTGSVSSLIGCTGLLMGSLGMQLISLNWANTIIALGSMMIITATTSLVLWPMVIKHAKRLPGPGATVLEASSQSSD